MSRDSPPMRVLLDTNIFISYLLDRQGVRPLSRIVKAGLAGVFTLLVTEMLLEELRQKAQYKPYLAARIAPAEVAALIGLITDGSEMVVTSQELPFVVPRDPKDDFLLTAAVLGQADYLVTGDADLLILGEVGAVQIVSPGAFVQLLGPTQLIRGPADDTLQPGARPDQDDGERTG